MGTHTFLGKMRKDEETYKAFMEAFTEPYGDDVPEDDEKVPQTCDDAGAEPSLDEPDDAIDPPVRKIPEDTASEKRTKKRVRDDGDTPKNAKRKTPGDTAYPCKGKQSGICTSPPKYPGGSPESYYFRG